MNLIRLYTVHGPMWIDTEQLARDRRSLTIYTARGNRAADTARTEQERTRAAWGVHRDNLFASPALAEANYERIRQDIASRGNS